METFNSELKISMWKFFKPLQEGSLRCTKNFHVEIFSGWCTKRGSGGSGRVPRTPLGGFHTFPVIVIEEIEEIAEKFINKSISMGNFLRNYLQTEKSRISQIALYLRGLKNCYSSFREKVIILNLFKNYEKIKVKINKKKMID